MLSTIFIYTFTTNGTYMYPRSFVTQMFHYG